MAAKGNEKSLTLNILTPDSGFGPVDCDSVRLTVADGLKGNEGGLYSIRPGHAPAVIMLARGELTAYSNSQIILRAKTGDGFARVESGVVIVTVQEFSEI